MRDVSVVVPTWRRAEWLQLCLKSLCIQDLHPYEVLVVGRHEDRKARKVSESANDDAPFAIRWLKVARAGHIAPIIRCLPDVKGKVVAFLDDDCEPTPTWLLELVRPFLNPTVACVGGRVVTPGSMGKVRRDAGSIRWYGRHVGNVASLDLMESREVTAVMECNWAWRADILRTLQFDGALDNDDASMYGLDLCLQAKKLGWSVVYEPCAVVLHHAAPREDRLKREDKACRSLSYARNYTYIGLKHFNGLRRVGFRVWWWCIGERSAYAAVTAIADTLLRRKNVRARWEAAVRGRREGTLLWRAR